MKRIVNISKKSIVCLEYEDCNTFFEQTKGMMFRKDVVPLVFNFKKEQRIRLHSWFCPGSMDLILLNDNWEVVELLSEWHKKSSFTSKKKCLVLLELPPGTLAQSQTELGDILHFIGR